MRLNNRLGYRTMINVLETEQIFSLREHLILGGTVWLPPCQTQQFPLIEGTRSIFTDADKDRFWLLSDNYLSDQFHHSSFKEKLSNVDACFTGFRLRYFRLSLSLNGSQVSSLQQRTIFRMLRYILINISVKIRSPSWLGEQLSRHHEGRQAGETKAL